MKIISRGIFPLLFICMFIFSENKSVAQITIKSDQSETICAGTLVTYTATTTSCTSDIKQYTWNITDAANNVTTITRTTTKDTSIFITKAITNGAKVSAKVYWNNACTAASGSLSAIVSTGNYSVISFKPTLTGSIAGKSTSVCEGTSNSYSITPVSNATSYTWGLPNGWTGTSAVDSISAKASANSGTITVTANNACGSSNKLSLSISVKAKPATPGPISGPTTICVGTINTYSVTPVFGVIDYAWLSSINGWSIVGLDSTNVISMATKDFSSSGNLIVLAKNECGFRLDSIIEKEITVNKMPVIPNQTDTVCSGSAFKISPINIDSTIVPKGTSYTWSKPIYSGNVGDVTGGTSQSNKPAISDVLINHTTVFQTATYTVTPTSGTCTGKPFIQNVVIRTLPAAPSAIIGKDTSCANLANTYSVTPVTGALSYTWSLPNGWSGTSTKNSISATTTSVTSIGTLTVTANNICSSLPVTKAVFVKTKPATPGPISGPTTICAGTTNTYSVTPVTGAIYYMWSIPGNGWYLSGLDSGNIISFANSVSTIGGNLVAFAENECGFKSNSYLSITVNIPPVIPTQTDTICSGSAFTISPINIDTTIVPKGTTYSWSKPVYSGKVGDVTGGTAKSNKTSINDILINHTDTIQTATYTVTPTSRTCAGAAFTTKVDIYPSPIITNKTVTICSGSTFTVSPVNGKGTLLFAGTTYSWGAPTVTGGITGFTAQAGQSNIVQTLNNPSNFIQTATYTVTPKAALTGNCDGQPFLIEVSVNPNIVLPAQSFTVCNAIPFSIDLSNGANALVPKGTKYFWLKPTYSGIEGNLTGGEVQSNSLTINGTLVNNTFVAQIATYIVTPQVNTCIGSPFIVNVTVDPNFVIKNMSGAVCSGSTISSIPVSNSTNFIPPGYRYSWGLPIVTGGIQGATAGSNQFSISQTLINPTIAIQTARYVVFPTSAKGCVGAPFIITDSILPRPLKPSVSDFSNEQNQQITTQFCGGSTNISFNVNDPIEGCTYLWTALPKDLVTVRKNLSPNTVISFGASSTTYPATISVQPVFPSNRGDCASVNVVSTYTLSVGALTVKDSQNVFVQQPGNLLVCSDMNADSYQWGYDSIADGKPYFINGQEGQTFFPVQRFLTKEENPKLNLSDYWFWVIPYHEKGSYICKSKIYYNGPYSKNNVLKFELASLNLNDNPTKGAFDLMVKGDFYGNVTILVSDMLGQVIQQSDFKKQNGIETYHFDFTNLSIGIYAIQVRNDDMDAPLSVKLMIVR